MEITSYPGPVPGIEKKHFEPDQSIPPVPARNRRIGNFLKELRLAERRGTGIPKIQRRMRENGSPEAIFDFDSNKTYFRVILPAHPRYQVLHASREAAHLWSIGEKKQATGILERTFERHPSSGSLASQYIEYVFAMENIVAAEEVLQKFDQLMIKNEPATPYITMARLLIDRGRIKEASEVLSKIPLALTVNDKLEAAILKKKTRDFKGAHLLFAEAYNFTPDDPKLLHEFAQTKMQLARNSLNKRDKAVVEVRNNLYREALEMLRRVIQLTDDNVRKAWCWYDTARLLNWMRAPYSEIEAAYQKAQSLLPFEKRFKESYHNFLQRKKS